MGAGRSLDRRSQTNYPHITEKWTAARGQFWGFMKVFEDLRHRVRGQILNRAILYGFALLLEMA